MDWSYTERDVMLYALSVGCTRRETKYVYENDEEFAALPTFGVLALHAGHVLTATDFGKLVPNYNPMLLLHGEQYLELHQPIPTAGKLRTEVRVIDVLDKGSAALVVLGLTSRDADSGVIVLENEASIFLRGSGGFGKTKPKRRKPEAVASNAIPSRAPDAALEEETSRDLAALYRLNGDPNPLHIDQQFAELAGFNEPILHGLCTFGISGKHVLKAFGNNHAASVKSIKGRFVKHVFPGETLRTEMWLTSPETVVFQTRVLERDVIAISNAAVVFKKGALKRAKL